MLKTAKVPAGMEGPFVAAEALVSAYFRDRKELARRIRQILDEPE
jgi:hypothetical protein